MSPRLVMTKRASCSRSYTTSSNGWRAIIGLPLMRLPRSAPPSSSTRRFSSFVVRTTHPGRAAHTSSEQRRARCDRCSSTSRAGRQADKRGGDIAPITLQEASAAIEFELDEIIELDAALERLDAVDPRLRQIVELRFFAGLSEDDVAEILGVSVRTVGRDWLKARIFLLRELDRA
jgi:RNA polymerase sigma factor (sigma-70 family)